MPLIILLAGIALLLVLMVLLKFDGFISLLITAAFVGLLEGMPLTAATNSKVVSVVKSITNGFGSQGQTLIIIALGAMLGVLCADMGATDRLANTFLEKFGIKRAHLAVIVIAFIVGVVMFWEAAWIILIPVIFSLVRKTKLSLIWLAMPLSIGLSSMHSFLPPHPGPTAVAVVYNASLGRTLLYGLPLSIILGGAVALVWPRFSFVRATPASIPKGMVAEKDFADEEMPSFAASLTLLLVPIVLIAGSAIVQVSVGKSESLGMHVMEFIGDPVVALAIAVLIAICYFAIRKHIPLKQIVSSTTKGLKSIAVIAFIVGAGGSLKQVFVDGGISNYIVHVTSSWTVSPLLLAWLLAALIRIAVGSASVAVVAAAGVALPLLSSGAVNPELLTLATACGSLFCSHVNDPAFWLFKEFCGLSVGQTFKVRTPYTCILSILGLGGVMVESMIIPV